MTTTTKEKLTEYKLQQRRRDLIMSLIITTVAVVILGIYIMPLIFGIVTSLKTQAQASEPNAPILPMAINTFTYPTYNYEGEETLIYTVRLDGETRELALVEASDLINTFSNPFLDGDESIEWVGDIADLDEAPTFYDVPIGDETQILVLNRRANIIGSLEDGTAEWIGADNRALYRENGEYWIASANDPEANRRDVTDNDFLNFFTDPANPNGENVPWEGDWRELAVADDFPEGLYTVPFGEGFRWLVLEEATDFVNQLIDPADADAGLIEWVGDWRDLRPVSEDLEIFTVPFDDGDRELALLNPSRSVSEFIDPANPDGGLIEWEGNWRQLEPVREFSIQWSNYPEAWETIDFVRLLFNTLVYAFTTMIGTVIASSMVAYGFARFKFPGKNVLFMILLATIILPPAVTLVPQYAFFINVLDWGGTWWPLIIPQLFGNAYNVFLLRQYFMTIPREMEEAATIDGAGPIQTFIKVILPQAGPALTAVALFHFFFAWNDFFNPLIYLAGNPEANPISVGLTLFNGLYQTRNELVLAAAIISMILPLAIFFVAQRVFIQGIVITGVDK
jgi:multiple sugar transport system permease protein